MHMLYGQDLSMVLGCFATELERLPPNLHILGDSAYPISNSLITPFREVGNLKEEETRYSITHSSTSSVIDRAFALLKGKFGRQWT